MGKTMKSRGLVSVVAAAATISWGSMPAYAQTADVLPLTIHEDFEKIDAGQPWGKATVVTPNLTDVVTVSSDAPNAGKRCLKVCTTKDGKNTRAPYLFLRPKYTDGTATLAFSIKLDPGTVVWPEWRDWRSNPYKAGPAMRIDNGKLFVRDKSLMDLPAGKWARFEMTMPLTAQGAAKWDLTVTPQGGEKKTFTGLAVADKDFSQVNWIGFIAVPTSHVCFYIDDVDLSLKK